MRIYLAPMDGVLDVHLRGILTRLGGIEACVSEFIRVTDQKLPNRVFTRICPEIEKMCMTPSQTPVYVQLLGSNPEFMALNARKLADLGVKNIDLNFGCPAKQVNRNKGGAVLLKSPEIVEKIVRTVKQSLPKHVSLSAKIRLGYDHKDNYLENALAVENGGVDRIFVHARSKVDGYRPPVYWDYVGRIKQRLNIPVVANGDIWSLTDFKKCRDVTGCNEFMLGRGVLRTPDLPRQIQALSGEDYQPLTWQEIEILLFEHYQVTKENYPERYMGNRLKQWLSYLKKGYQEAELFFNEVRVLKTEQELDNFFFRRIKI